MTTNDTVIADPGSLAPSPRFRAPTVSIWPSSRLKSRTGTCRKLVIGIPQTFRACRENTSGVEQHRKLPHSRVFALCGRTPQASLAQTSNMPSFDRDRRSSRWGCSATQPLDNFYHDISPGDINNFHVKRKASPLLAPQRVRSHDPALWQHLLHQTAQAETARTKRPRPDNINPYLRRGSLPVSAAVRADKDAAAVKHVTLPEIPHLPHIKKLGISNGK